jgi:hypothetical protein
MGNQPKRTMNKEQQRIAIAEACGLTIVSDGIMHHLTPCGKKTERDPEGCLLKECPDYLNDLNAMHEAIGTLLFSQRRAYRINLKEIMSKKINPAIICYSECIDAPAAQRAEAFLKTIDKWIQ